MPDRALVAMSGGVDSSVAALLMLRDGFDCAGAIMKLHPDAVDSGADAQSVADKLGIPFFVFDFSEAFTSRVIKRFITDYREGRTPNPCIECNRHLKFGSLLEKTRELSYDCIVTGHYARIVRSENGRFLLKRGADLSKDQSYVLYSLKQDQLARIKLPLGELSKSQVRELAQNAQLDNANRRESQDICFIPDGDYARFIVEYSGKQPRNGRFVDIDGNYLGDHNGVLHFTVGQRRGIGLAMPHPMYVLELRPEDDTVIIGKNEQLFSKTLFAGDINLIPVDRLDAPLRGMVKIRYKHSGQPATVYQIDDNTLRIDFDEPQRAITKGQAAVVFDGDTVIGGGTII